MKGIDRLIKGAAAAAVAFAVLVGPASAQDAPGPRIERERMTQYVRAHIALNDARDEFHGKVGRVHDEQGREQARVEMEEQVAAALEAQSMTREQYDEITLLISLDGPTRELFDEVMAEVREGGGPG